MITPKFDMATPLNRTVSRTAKADEKFLMSMQGSPVYVGGRSRSTKNENLIPLPIGKSKIQFKIFPLGGNHQNVCRLYGFAQAVAPRKGFLTCVYNVALGGHFKH